MNDETKQSIRMLTEAAELKIRDAVRTYREAALIASQNGEIDYSLQLGGIANEYTRMIEKASL